MRGPHPRWRSSIPATKEALATIVGLAVAVLAMRLMLPAVTTGWPFTDRRLIRADDVLLGLIQLIALSASGWLALGCLATALGSLPGACGRWFRRIGEAITPRVVRQGLTVVLSAAVGSAALPTSAAGRDPGKVAGQTQPSAPSPSFVGGPTVGADPVTPPTAGLPSPGFGQALASSVPVPPAPSPGVRPTPTATGPAPASPGFRPSRPVPVHREEQTKLLAPSPRFGSAVSERVVVRKGDTLWAIAARHLGAEASDAQIARAWPRWYAANADVIGDDPDLILPGMQLRVPEEGV